MDVLVFSKCQLLSFSFEYIFNHVFNANNLKKVMVKTYEETDSFVSAIDQNTQLVLVDITLTGYIDVYIMLSKIKKKSRVIILCDEKTDLRVIPNVYNAILYKTSSILNIITTIERVCDDKYSNMVVDLERDTVEIPQLTKNEKKTLKLIVAGLNNHQIAQLLAIPYKKVIDYRFSICQKYNVNSLDISYHKHGLPVSI
ncbi:MULTISPECIES: helix-turn-helix transcriptional regulator [Yersinia]|jgi:FixJ family two-component response regulator|uniref:Two component system sensor kinase SsrB n=3 Tax=Yersinia TaxID=629 RepID=A0AAI9EMN0_YERFR|nr:MULTISPECIES: LuxR C-terminal-related transcriptional regulator [Yersinia]HEI6965801.1 response regulator transcription factor [Yersinia enterocolitica]ATM88553.1 DNA-binding response regulator [Yersinia frederiksenii]AVX39641.1 DNA-binding response regulator [Yersinia massiliensis]MCB5316773.1 LuxR C-terminal-related transcriptional regulator [Yersinia massiliensis]MDN0125920.1 LuxR C-terminal-related transcriptional regulator [Yersinia massiliensis]